jgi:hypothetical protein
MTIHKKRIRIIDTKEPWCEATLENGIIIKIKSVFISIYAHFDMNGNPILNENGLPMHDVNAQAMIAIELPDGTEAATEKPKAQVLRLVEGNDTEKRNEE